MLTYCVSELAHAILKDVAGFLCCDEFSQDSGKKPHYIRYQKEKLHCIFC